MTFDEVWKILNQPLSILLFGSGVGWLFVKLVWEPSKRREADAMRRQAIREEVDIRLFLMDRNPANAYSNVHGVDADSLDPVYKPWSLRGLIFAGWGRDALARCISQMEMDRLVLSEADRADSQRVQAVRDALQRMRQVLGLPAV